MEHSTVTVKNLIQFILLVFISSVLGSELSNGECEDGTMTRSVQDLVKSELTKISPLGAEEETNPMIFLPKTNSYFGTNNPIIEDDHEGPEQLVTVDAFYMQQFEVSNLEFATFVSKTGYVTDAEKFNFSFLFHSFLDSFSEEFKAQVTEQVQDYPWWLPVYGSNWFHIYGTGFQQGNVFELNMLEHPVIHVSHNDATAYCNWLGYRLPTEVEFERAAHGENNSKNQKYPWGDKLHTRDNSGKLVYHTNVYQGSFPTTNSVKDGYEFTSPVSAFGPQNMLGFHNLIGNVWEWVQDEYIPGKKQNEDPGKVLKQGNSEVERVKKGGSFLCHKSYCFRYRIAARSHNTADTSAHNLGFRCASSLNNSP